MNQLKPQLIFKSMTLMGMMLIAFHPMHAQNGNVGYYYQGEDFFQHKKYYEAAQCYEKYLTTEKKNRPRAASVPFGVEKKISGKTNQNVHQEAVYHLAESYRLYKDFPKAEKWYRQAYNFSREAYPEIGYWFGTTLHANQKFDEAILVLTNFKDSFAVMGPLIQAADRELNNLKFIKSQIAKKGKSDFKVEQRTGGTDASSYALTVKIGDTLVFTSVYKDSSAGKKGKYATAYHNQLYETVDGAHFSQNASAIPLPNDGQENGLACFSKDGKKMFFTKWVKIEGVNESAVYTCTKSDSGWSKPIKMNDPINMEGYNSTQPFITEDSRFLLFASDRPGGIGKYDLYYAAIDSNLNVLAVNNMGSMINTPDDDEAPFFHTGTRTLIFSSNGRVGMGGFDIYAAKGEFDLSHWDKPVNMGTPINSVRDDIYYISTDSDNVWNTGWLSSDRNNDCCLAIFEVKQKSAENVFGDVIDCVTQKPLPGAVLKVYDLKNPKKILLEKTTDSLGHYAFLMHNVSRYIIQYDKPDYVGKEKAYLVHMEIGKDTITNETICLESVRDTALDHIRDILKSLSHSPNIGKFTYNKADLNGAAEFKLDSVVDLMKRYPFIKIQLNGYTDGKGTVDYNLKLAQRRIDACIDYLVRLGGINKDRLISKPMGKCCPIAPENINGKDYPEGRAKNRRVEYSVVTDAGSN